MTVDTAQIAEVTAANVAIWNRCAPTYTAGFEELTSGAVAPLLDLAGVGRGTRLLDVGTGPGALVGPALERGATVIAIDVAPAMLAELQPRHPSVDGRLADAHNLPFDDESFDAVTIGFCLHHTADPSTVLREAQRVLRPGGRVASTVWDTTPRLEAFGLAFAAFADVLSPADPADGPPPPIGAEPSDYERLLADAGFDTPTARILDLAWAVRDSATLYDGFARFLDLGDLAADRAAGVRRRIDAALRQWADADGVARVPNPAVIASGRRP